MKLKDMGVVWIEDSMMYVADKSLFNTPSAFLHAVLEHIYGLDRESECGWFKYPLYDEYINKVNTSFMAHRLGLADEPGWWMQDEAGRGNRPIWCIDFSRRK